MAKPTKHGDKWRVRWLDEHGARQSAVFDDYKRAQTELRQRQVEVDEIKRGVRNAAPPEKTFGDLCVSSYSAINRSAAIYPESACYQKPSFSGSI